MINISKTKGFTLIELLIVIAIIGILTSVVVVNLTEFRGKGRDARRLAEMNTIRDAAEKYIQDEYSVPADLDAISTYFEGTNYKTDPLENSYGYAVGTDEDGIDTYFIGTNMEVISANDVCTGTGLEGGYNYCITRGD